VAPGGIEILQSGSRHRLAGKSDPDVAARLTNSRKHCVNQLSKAILKFVSWSLVELGLREALELGYLDAVIWPSGNRRLPLSHAPTGLTG
jgi:hypothetical protein